MEHRPETVVHVEPESDETDDVDDRSPYFLECHLDEECSESRGHGSAVELRKHGKLMMHEFLPLHFVPELDQVNNEEREDHDAENEHVL